MSSPWDLPFFEPRHRELALSLADWAARQHVDESDDRAACRTWVSLLGKAQWLGYCVPRAFGGHWDRLDSRALVIIRRSEEHTV